MPTTKETLEMCKVLVDALAVGAMNGFSYHPSSMVELSGYISVAIDRENRLTKRVPDVAKSGDGKSKISGKRPARSPRR